METHSFRFELGGRPTRNKTYKVYLTITVGGRRSRVTTPVEVEKRTDFNTKAANNKWIRKGVQDSMRLNDELSRIIEDARNRYLELQKSDGVSASTLADSIRSRDVSDSFITFTEKRIQEIYCAGGIRNAKQYTTLLNKIKKHRQGKDLLFSEITYSYLNSFKMFLEKQSNCMCKDRRLHPNTIQALLTHFRALVNAAVRENKMAMSKNPFLIFSVKGVKTQKEKLSPGELERLVGLDLEEGSTAWHCRNFFMFSFYCAGIRVGDLMQLRWRNIIDGRLNYQMGKNHKVRDLVLVKPALELLRCYAPTKKNGNDYIFPILDDNADYAKYIDYKDIDSMPLGIKEMLMSKITSKTHCIDKELRRLAQLAGIDKPLTMHISRHTFAKMARDSGIDCSAIQKMLAHSSLRITENYMGEFDTKATDNALRNIFNSNMLNKETQIDLITKMLKLKDDEYISRLYDSLLNEINGKVRNTCLGTSPS